MHQLNKPKSSFCLSIDVSYTSPQGRNYYRKDAKITDQEIKKILPEIEKEKADKERKISELLEIKKREKLEREADKILKEEERKAIRDKREQERALERKELLQYRERVRAEERLILAEYTASQNKKIYDQLKKKEELLEQREEEFKNATKSHIYSLSDKPLEEKEKQDTKRKYEETISAWEKMKELKKEYETGMITYEEYAEKRKHLL